MVISEEHQCAASSLHSFEFLVSEAEAGVVVPTRRSPFLVVVRALKIVQLEIWAAYLFHSFALRPERAGELVGAGGAVMEKTLP